MQFLIAIVINCLLLLFWRHCIWWGTLWFSLWQYWLQPIRICLSCKYSCRVLKSLAILQLVWSLFTLFEKLKSHSKRMLKVELINNLKGAYYRVDLRIKWFFLQTGCGAIYCWKNGIPSNVSNQKNNATHHTNFLRPSTLLLCKKIIC